MEVIVKNINGSETGKKVALNDSIFGITPNDTVIYEDVRSYLANQRQGNAKTKGRSEIRGTTKKAYRQKGTGSARRGDMKSPILVGGGISFGPKPRDYFVRMNKKSRVLARKSALAYKAKEDAVLVVEDFTFDEPKTANAASMINALGLNGERVLILTSNSDQNLLKSYNNIPKVDLLEANKVNTYQIMHATKVVFMEGSLALLESTLLGEGVEA